MTVTLKAKFCNRSKAKLTISQSRSKPPNLMMHNLLFSKTLSKTIIKVWRNTVIRIINLIINKRNHVTLVRKVQARA